MVVPAVIIMYVTAKQHIVGGMIIDKFDQDKYCHYAPEEQSMIYSCGVVVSGLWELHVFCIRLVLDINYMYVSIITLLGK